MSFCIFSILRSTKLCESSRSGNNIEQSGFGQPVEDPVPRNKSFTPGFDEGTTLLRAFVWEGSEEHIISRSRNIKAVEDTAAIAAPTLEGNLKLRILMALWVCRKCKMLFNQQSTVNSGVLCAVAVLCTVRHTIP